MQADDKQTQQFLRIAKGDKQAFSQLLAEFLPVLLAFIRRYIHEPAQAEDIAQETFLRVWQRAADWQPGEHTPRSWIYRIALNLCIDNLRRQKPTSDALHALVDSHSAEQHAIAQNQHQHLHAAITQLPERQRTALYLCAFQGLSNKEAAAIMKIGVDALESLLARARRTLRQYFADLEEGERYEPKLSIIR
ncbi:MAG: sigma-70 family RNA polymerase sigma factor [Gammaproteobacteria bacterium]|jgi:RNA polymerase sigma-70 factor, ECF subfamily